jgi:hypothetical protein
MFSFIRIGIISKLFYAVSPDTGEKMVAMSYLPNSANLRRISGGFFPSRYLLATADDAGSGGHSLPSRALPRQG